jgi:1-acyl-sn-glycerol-3-phosphate acyltransferase
VRHSSVDRLLAPRKPIVVDRFGDGYSAGVAQLFYGAVRNAGEALGAELDGIERIPQQGGAVLVANHTFGYDVAYPISLALKRMGRQIWVLGDHTWWKIPWVRSIAEAVGVVDGNADVADRLLARGELVLVLPGGFREAVKPRELRYQLLWGKRYGFVRLAIRHQVPLIPLACVGADDLFDFVGNAYARGRRWLGLKNFPIPLPARILPIPHRASLRFIVGEPIVPDVAADKSEDLPSLRWLRREVAGALHELIEDELARRAGIVL